MSYQIPFKKCSKGVLLNENGNMWYNPLVNEK